MVKPVDDEQPVQLSSGTVPHAPWPKEQGSGVMDLRTANRIADIEAMLAGVTRRFEREIEELRREIKRHSHP